MTIEQYKNHTFESSCSKTPEFKKFARRFRHEVKKMFTDDTTIVFNTGHFYISGHIQNPINGKWAYFSISDVRDFRDWYDEVLVRTAESEVDYTGGTNCYTAFHNLGAMVSRLTA